LSIIFYVFNSSSSKCAMIYLFFAIFVFLMFSASITCAICPCPWKFGTENDQPFVDTTKITIFADFTRRTTLKDFLLTRTELNQSVFTCIVSSWCLPFISIIFQASREVQDGQKTSNSAGGGPNLPIFGTFAYGLIPHGDGSTWERLRRCSLRPTTLPEPDSHLKHGRFSTASILRKLRFCWFALLLNLWLCLVVLF